MTSCNHMTFYHLMLDDQLKEALLIGQNAVTWCSPQSNADQVMCSGWRSWWGSGVARNFQSVAILSVHSRSAALPSRRYNQKTSWHIIPPEWLNIVCRIRLESIEARLSLTDKNIGTFAIGFTRRPITLRNHTKKYVFSWQGVRTPLTPLVWLCHCGDVKKMSHIWPCGIATSVTRWMSHAVILSPWQIAMHLLVQETSVPLPTLCNNIR